MTRRVFRGDGVPAEVLDGDAGLGAHCVEAHMELGLLTGPKAGVAPTEHEAMRWFPHPHGADLEEAAVVVDLDQLSVHASVQLEPPGTRVGELEERIWSPPLADLLGERRERASGGRADAQRDEHARRAGHGVLSTWFLKAASCCDHPRSVR